MRSITYTTAGELDHIDEAYNVVVAAKLLSTHLSRAGEGASLAEHA